MESDVITWKIVPNTVANRMKNRSLIHKLTPTRRLSRRSKTMNIAIKQSRGLKTYSQYVKMKTSILRNMSDNSETDEDATFTDDDYSIFYKPDKFSTNYRKRMSKENKRNYEIKFESDENDIVLNGKNEKTPKDSRSKSSKHVKVGEQRAVKKKNKIICSLARKETKGKNRSIKYSNSISSQMDNDIDLSSQANDDNRSQKNHSNSANEILINTEACTAEKSIEPYDNISTNSNKVTHNISVLQEITNDSSELINSISRFNEISKKFTSNENQSCNMLDSPKVQAQGEEGKKSLPSSSYNADDIRSGHDSYTNIKTNSDQNLFLCLDKNPNIMETSTNKFAENDRPCEIDSSVTINTCQPKDSGIEEDTEEEFSEHAREGCQEVENKIENTQQNMSGSSSPFNCKSNSTDIDVDLKLGHYSANKLDSKDTTCAWKYGSTNDVEEPKEKVHKHKLQPKVTHTEIVNKKYKIISTGTYVSNVCANLEESSMKDSSYEGVRETEEVEDSISILTRKRLEKLRKLNLTTDSDSSLSENDDAHCNVENMREKLLKRSEESSDASDDTDENVHSDREISIQFDKNLENGKDFEKKSLSYKESNKKKESKVENCLEKEANCPVDTDDISRQCTKVKKDLLLHIKDNTLSDSSNKPVQEKRHSLVCTTRNFNQVEDVKRSDENNPEIKNTIQAMNKKATRHHRPCNVQEIVEEENLTVETAIPSFTFKSIEEDDELFIIDVPSAIFKSQLVGKKMVLTEKTLKLGKRKYKVKYRNIDNISCVFASGKSRKPYKTVNIQPVARVMAREKITRKSLGKWSNLYTEI
ncbi:hypothetical protein ANTPLA_LOCUS36 [Anthophora plagiata]